MSELIRQLWREIHREGEVNEEALAGPLLKYQKVSAMRFITAAMAPKMIIALKGWKARERNFFDKKCHISLGSMKLQDKR